MPSFRDRVDAEKERISRIFIEVLDAELIPVQAGAAVFRVFAAEFRRTHRAGKPHDIDEMRRVVRDEYERIRS